MEENAGIERLNKILEKYREIGFKVGSFNPNAPSPIPLLERYENFEKIMRDNLKAMIVHELVEFERLNDNIRRMGIQVNPDFKIAQELDRICESGDVLSEDAVAKTSLLRNEIRRLNEEIYKETVKIVEKIRRIEQELELLPTAKQELLPLIKKVYERFEAKRYYEVWFNARRVIEEYEGKLVGGIVAKINYLNVRIGSLKSMGIDVSEEESFLTLARAQFAAREIEKAWQSIERCTKLIERKETESISKQVAIFEKYLARAKEVIQVEPNLEQRIADIKNEIANGNYENANKMLKNEVGEIERLLNLTLTNLNNVFEKVKMSAEHYGIPVNQDEVKKIQDLIVTDKIEGIKMFRDHIRSIEKKIEEKRNEVKVVRQEGAEKGLAEPGEDLKARIEKLNSVLAKYMEGGVKLRLFDPNAQSKIPLLERFENYEKLILNNLKAFITQSLIDYERNIDNAKKMGIACDENPLLIDDLEKAIENDNVISMEIAEKVRNLLSLNREIQQKIEKKANEALEDLKKFEKIILDLPVDKEYLNAQISKAKERFEAKRFYEAHLFATKVLSEIEGKAFPLLLARIERAEKQISELKALGIDCSSLTKILNEAKERYEAKDFVKANEILEGCEKEIQNVLSANLLATLEKFESYIKALEEFVRLSDVWPRIEEIKRAIKEGRNEEAKQLLGLEMERAQKEMEAFVSALLNSLQKTLECGKIAGKDFGNEMEYIRKGIEQNRLEGIKKAMRLQNEIQRDLQNMLREKLRKCEQLCGEIGGEKKEKFINALASLSRALNSLPFLPEQFLAWYKEVERLESELCTELEKALIPNLELMRNDLKVLVNANFNTEKTGKILKEISIIISEKRFEDANRFYANYKEEVVNIIRKFIEQELKPLYEKITEVEIYKINLDAEREELRKIEESWELGRLEEVYRKIEEVKKDYDEKIRSIIKQKIEMARANLTLIYEFGIDQKADIYEEYIKNAEASISGGALSDALRNLMNVSEVYKKIRARMLAGIEELEAKARVIAELGLSVGEFPDIVVKINEAIESEEFKKAWDLLKESRMKLDKMIEERIASELKNIESAIEDLKKFVKPSETLSIAYEMAKNLSAERKWKEAKVFLVRCRTLISEEAMKIFEKDYAHAQQMLKFASARGISTTLPASYLNNFRREVGSLHLYQAKWFIETAKRLLDEEIKKAAKSEIQSFSDVINLYSPIFGKDFFLGLQKRLANIIELYQGGKFVECIDEARKTRDEINQTLSERIRKEVDNLRTLIEKFERYGIDFEEIRNLTSQCLAYLDSEKAESALTQLKEAKNRVNSILTEFLKERAGDVEELMRTAQKLGGSTERYDEALNNAKHLIEEQEFVHALEVIDEVGKEVATQLHALVYRKLVELNGSINALAESGVVVSEEVKRHRDACSAALASGQYFEAMHEVELARNFLVRNIKASVAEKLKETNALLEIGKSIGCEMKESQQILSELENAINMIDITKVSVLLKNLENVPRNELETYLNSLISETSEIAEILSKEGAQHESAKEIIQQALNQLNWKNYGEAYYSLERIRPLLLAELRERVKGEFERYEKIAQTLEKLGVWLEPLKEKILSGKAKLKDAQAKELMALLTELKSVLEEINLKNAERLKKETENRLAGVQREIARWEKLGLEANEFYAMVKKVGEFVEAHNYVEACALIYALDESLNKAMEYRLREVIEDVKQKLGLARKLGVAGDYNAEPLLSFADYGDKERMVEACTKLVEIEKMLDVENLARVKAIYEETERLVHSLREIPQGYLIALDRAKAMINTGKYLEAYVLIERCRNLLGAG